MYTSSAAIQSLVCSSSSVNAHGIISGFKSHPSSLPFPPVPHPTISQVLQPLPRRHRGSASAPCAQPCPVLAQAPALVRELVAPQLAVGNVRAAVGNVCGPLRGQGCRQGTRPVCNLLPSSPHQAQLRNPLLPRALPPCALCPRPPLRGPPASNHLRYIVMQHPPFCG